LAAPPKGDEDSDDDDDDPGIGIPLSGPLPRLLPNSLASWIIALRFPNSSVKYPFVSLYPSPCGLPLQTVSMTTGSGGGVPSSNITRPLT
jgi:hypothetical protein